MFIVRSSTINNTISFNRMGKIFEDLDSLAANISYQHCETTRDKVTIITASIDRLDLVKPLSISDIRLSGK